MNNTQKRMIERIQRELETSLSSRYNNLELKRLETETNEWGQVYLTIEYGSKDDEGTLASAWCHETRLIVIGKRGGLTNLAKDCPVKFKHSMAGVIIFGYK